MALFNEHDGAHMSASQLAGYKELLEKREKELDEFDPTYIIQRNNKVIIGNQIALSIKLGDNLIVLEDKYKDPELICDKCGGRGKNRFDTACADCNGTGVTKAKIILAESAKARPTSGKIVAIGPLVKYRFHLFGWHFWKRNDAYSINDRVAYSGYTGHLIPFKGNTRLRIMRINEPFCLVENLREGKIEIEFIDKDTAYDLT